MRTVIVSMFAVLSVTGCATVSMVPASAVVEASVTQEQSRLRDASDAYVTLAKDSHWIASDGGLMGLANRLMNGADGTAKAATYADHIKASSAVTPAIYARLTKDIQAARAGLDAVTREAKSVLTMPNRSEAGLRKDVFSYETSLVTAQKARRSFAEALTLAAARNKIGAGLVEAELAKFDDAIDAARKTADAVAQAYAQMPGAGGQS